MPSCSVKWCRSHTDMKNNGLTFHKFPANGIQRGKWVAAIRLERNEPKWMPGEFSKLCGIHFRSEDIYVVDDGKRKRLRKSAVPICTMVGPAQPPDDFQYSKKNYIAQKASLKQVDIEVNLEEDTRKRTLHIPECSCTVEKMNEIQENCSHQMNVVKIEHISTDSEEKLIIHETEEPVWSYEEEKKSTIVECPSCKHNFCIPAELLENEARLKDPNNLNTPFHSPSSDIINIFAAKELEKQLTIKTALATKRYHKMTNLLRQNKRLKLKQLKLINVIKNFKKYGFDDSMSGVRLVKSKHLTDEKRRKNSM